MQDISTVPVTAFAQWLDRTTVVWPTPGSGRHTLEYGADRVLPLDPMPGGLPPRLRARYPHLAGCRAFTVCAVDVGVLGDALRAPLVATERDQSGRLVAATGVQIPGVLDDVYVAAAGERLGPVWYRGTPRLSVWAPTARSVTLKLYTAAAGGQAYLVPMRRHDLTGVWSVVGEPRWRGCYYTYLVTVYAPSARAVVTNEVTDPYSLSLSADSVRSQLVDLSDDALAPPGWAALRKPAAVRADQASIYELHVREFSVSDRTVPEPLRGKYSAFTVRDSAGMRALRELAGDGLTHVQLMPVFDFAATRERHTAPPVPPAGLAGLPSHSERQQEWVDATKGDDGYDWGYDPLHYTVPEGSYATDADGPARIRELRAAVAALNEAGLRVVMDVVYNHTHAVEQDPRSVLDRIVPGYYQRLRDDGTVCSATGCHDTAPEHLMMAKLVTDSVLTWAEEYKIDGFRFDLMGFHPKAEMVALRTALDKLDTVEGTEVLLYGEGWEFGEIAGDARFVQATQRHMAGTGIGTFNDRLRDALRGGSPLDADPRAQGFGSGLHTAPNGAPVNGGSAEQRARLLRYQDVISVGLTGNLDSYRFPDGPAAGYNASPDEAITYVDCHDNQTLFDALAHRLPRDTAMADRVRMQSLSLAVVLLGQGAAFVLSGTDRLRSKSLDRNSYNSGDWFNRLLWHAEEGNGFGVGLPPASDNRAYWRYDRPLLADPGLRPDRTAIEAAHARFREFLRIRCSSPAFAIGSAVEIRRRVTFPGRGTPGVITMRIDTTGLDPRWRAVIVVFNATPDPCAQTVDAPGGTRTALHPVLAESVDPVVRRSTFDAPTATLTVPARTTAVFTQT